MYRNFQLSFAKKLNFLSSISFKLFVGQCSNLKSSSWGLQDKARATLLYLIRHLKAKPKLTTIKPSVLPYLMMEKQSIKAHSTKTFKRMLTRWETCLNWLAPSIKPRPLNKFIYHKMELMLGPKFREESSRLGKYFLRVWAT